MRLASALPFTLIAVAACSDGGASPNLDAPVAADAAADAAIDAAAAGAVTFRLSYQSDVPDVIYAQTGSEAGGQAWVTVRTASGAPVAIQNACGVCDCGACDPCPVCGAGLPEVTAIARGGQLDWTWDATTFVAGTCATGGAACEQPTALPAGDYLARFCWSLTADGVGPGHHVGELTCIDVPFSYPLAPGAGPVEHHECACG